MAHTYCHLMYHTVFSTKCRKPLIQPEMMPELVKVVGGIIRDRDGRLLAMNGTSNHVHLLNLFQAKHSVSEMLRDIKAVSSDWVHERFSDSRAFAWQAGYGCFSVSKSNCGEVEKYIDNQEPHHRRQSFEEELIALLERHGVEFDRRYVFD